MDKLSWVELRKAIAERINTSEKEVGTFMNALVPSIMKALQEDRQVRITNFGTFKLQTVAPRKSVNVATGETFTLPGYEKLTFTPESSIRELVGNLNETPDPTQDDATPLRKLGEQAEEIVGLLNDLGQSPKQEEPAKPVESPAPETPVVEPEPIKTETHMSEEKPIEEKPIEEKKEKKNRTWLVVGITVLVFALLLAGAFLFLGNRFVSWVNGLHDNAEQPEQVIEIPEEPIIVGDTIPEPDPEVEKIQAVYSNITYKKNITKERLPEGSRLAWLATKYYGERELWVFIYEANKKTIKHPSDIPVGTTIVIPKLPPELMDYSNPAVKHLVDSLAAEYKKL